MILKYLRKVDWALLAATVVFVFLQVYLELEIPGYMNKITTIMTTGGTSQDVMEEGKWMLACAFGSLVMAVIVGFIAAYIGTYLGKTLRERQFDNVQRYSATELNRFSIYSLITRSTNDVNQVQMAFTIGLMVMIRAPIMAVWAIMKISTKNVEWTSATVVAIVAMVSCIALIIWYVFPRFKRIQWLNDDVNRITKEGLSGIRVVHAYNAEGFQERRFEKANEKLTNTHLEITRAFAFLFPAMTTIMSVLSMVIYWLGAVIINATESPMERITEFSDMIVFSSYAMQVIGAFMMLIIVFMILPRAMVAAKRIEEVINADPVVKDGSVEDSPDGREGEIVFRNVSFRYPESANDSLTDISFELSKGETLAIIGSTGSGKSTLVNLIPRFYDVTDGQILIDGVDIREYNLESLRGKIGYVPQKASLFTGTIESNVNYGGTEEERTEDDVRKAVEIAQARDFVERTEGQYQGKVAEGGTNLSGGQKQRISIARAVCKRPEIYIFDDSFSALDYRTDRLLRSELRKETAGVTTIIVAQRIGTIMDADRIIVLDEGRMVGMGTHHELLKNCEVYHQIAASQLSEEELMR
jgi:ATP-binding cassette subfamily B protein